MSVWAVIPAKSFGQAKSRLVRLSDDRRVDLARQLFAHALSCALACETLAGVLVLTNGDDVAAMARARGAEVLRDPAHAEPSAGRPGHLGRVVDAGLAHLHTRGATRVVVLMADLPRLATADIADLVELARTHPMVLAPDVREQGTNALALRLSSASRTCFGHADSLQRHLHLAAARGIAVHLHRAPALALDLDLPTDLENLETLESLESPRESLESLGLAEKSPPGVT